MDSVGGRLCAAGAGRGPPPLSRPRPFLTSLVLSHPAEPAPQYQSVAQTTPPSNTHQKMGAQKAIIVGLSGCSSSGKTTLARLLRDIFPNSFVLHEDDFYRPEDE